MTGSLADQMAARLRERLAPTRLEVIDDSWRHQGHAHANGTGFDTHFRIRIAAPAFAPLTRVEQHRLVYDALADFMARGVHAIAIEIC
jgi:BolA protein